MKPITQWQADDGSVWRTEKEAIERDAVVAKCAALAEAIGLRPIPQRGTDFANGGGFVQQPEGARDKLYAALMELGANRDSGGPVGDLLYRWHCMDDAEREWGQPYFARYDGRGKGKMVELVA